MKTLLKCMPRKYKCTKKLEKILSLQQPDVWGDV